MGDKDVAVDFSQLEWAQLPDGARRWVMSTTPEALAAAPAFIWTDSEDVTGPAHDPGRGRGTIGRGRSQCRPGRSRPYHRPARPPASSTRRSTAPALMISTRPALTADELRGTGVYGINDEQIGTIGDVVAGHRTAPSMPSSSMSAAFLASAPSRSLSAYDNLTFSVRHQRHPLPLHQRQPRTARNPARLRPGHLPGRPAAPAHGDHALAGTATSPKSHAVSAWLYHRTCSPPPPR